MLCPYCNEEMSKGYFTADSCALQWIPEESKPASLRWNIAKGGIQLTEVPVMLVKRKEAFACKKCSKIVIDYSENKS